MASLHKQSLPYPLIWQVIQNTLIAHGQINFLRTLDPQITWRNYSRLIQRVHGSLFIKKKTILRVHSFLQNEKQLICPPKMWPHSILQWLPLLYIPPLPLQSPRFSSPPTLQPSRLWLLNHRWPPQRGLQWQSLLSLQQSFLQFWHMWW